MKNNGPWMKKRGKTDFMGIFRNWIPWRLIIRRAAKAHGFIDPIRLMARLRQFAQPSEVQEPIELLRAGIVFHARGLVNAKAIQHNLDWIWPFWVEKQFNPGGSSFIPRAFSISHINLTHRNWTAVGLPDMDTYPIVDPRGLVTPFFDGWSIDFWLLGADGQMLIPSRSENTTQELIFTPNLEVITTTASDLGTLSTRVRLERESGKTLVRITCNAGGGQDIRLVVSVRPYNPEGVQFIEKIQTIQQSEADGILVNGTDSLYFDHPPADYYFSNYSKGDVIHKRHEPDPCKSVQCRVGMATGAAVFPLDNNTGNNNTGTREINLYMSADTAAEKSMAEGAHSDAGTAWSSAIKGTAALQVPDPKIQFLYDSAIRTLALLSARQIVPGPYTYKRFWYRDACLMMHAMLAAGFEDRCRTHLDTFPSGQKVFGYFQSQQGEWDSNGQVLWIADRYQELSNQKLDASWIPVIKKAARWIERKRLSRDSEAIHAGLLPPGFSAEHLGPNDYYYWDNFWSIAGLQAAARTMRRFEDRAAADAMDRLASNYKHDLEKSVARIPEKQARGCIPASPYRRMDPGAIGSLVADYPLALYPVDASPMARTGLSGTTMFNTARFLVTHCFHDGGFFQDMIHSGINAYLTLAIAQTLLRYGDHRYRDLVTTVADLASPTGQWPEAIHPITKGGCMGDGQHGWAAAEWVMMIRNLFVREEQDKLILGSGIFPEWLDPGTPLVFGPGPTPCGPVTVRLTPSSHGLSLTVTRSDEHGKDRPVRPDWPMEARVPGYQHQTITEFDQPVRLTAE